MLHSVGFNLVCEVKTLNVMNEGKSTNAVPKFERRYDLDWLRIIAVFTVFFFHLAGFFATPLASIFTIILAGFGMPIFFLISGMGIHYVLKRIPQGLLVKERFFRLIIPFLVGLFTHLSIQVYYIRLRESEFTGSLLDFYPKYYDGIFRYGGNFPILGLHLWFLPVLFLHSTITLPLFAFLTKESNRASIAKVANFLNKPGALFLLAIPLIIVEMIDPLSAYDVRFTGWNMFSYLLFLIYGFLLVSEKQFQQSIIRHGLPAFFISIFLAILGLPIYYFLGFTDIVKVILGLYGWSMIIVLLNIGRKYLNFQHKSLKFLSEIGLPFYIIHQTVLVVVAYYVINWELLNLGKFLIITVVSWIIIFGLILVIRQVNALRLLFGMRLKKKPATHG